MAPGFTSWDFLPLPLPSLRPFKENVRMYAFLPWLRNFLWKVGVGGGKGLLKGLFMFGCAGSSLWYVRLSLVAVSRGCCLVMVWKLLIAVVSLVAEHGL